MNPWRQYACLLVILAAGKPAAAEDAPLPLPKQIESTLKEVSPAVVSVWYGTPPRHVSGTCVDVNGLVLTCGHIKRDVDDAVEVRFAGRKPVAAKVVAKSRAIDVALLRVAGEGKWPAVPLGDAAGLTADDPLLALGYGITSLYGRDPDPPVCYVRLSRRKEQRLWPNKNELLTGVVSKGGDSGGPLFDLGGALVGVCSNGEADGSDTRYVSIDAVLREWDVFAKDVPKPAVTERRRPRVAGAAVATEKAVAGVRPTVVEVQAGDRWVGVGVHVGRGLFLTKASELGKELSVLLADGTAALAEVASRDPATDLALLRLRAAGLADGLPEVRWADRKEPVAGGVVAAVTPPAFTPLAGVVCVPARAVPPTPGILPVRVKDGKGGAAVEESFDDFVTPWLRPPVFPLQPGDVITRVANTPVADADGFRKLVFGGKELGGHPRVIGEAVEVAWTRGGKAMKERVHLRPQQTFASQRVRPYSYRHTGFARAFAADFAARPEHCGAPVVDPDGRVVGVLIARAPFVESLVLPAPEARAATERMLKGLAMK
jgi:S1-C subfamily serine protease